MPRAAERHEHRARARRPARRDEDGDVARGLLEHVGRVGGQPRLSHVDEQQVDALLRGEPEDVARGRSRGERRRPGRDTGGHELAPALGDGRRRGAEVGRVDDRGDDQLARRLGGGQRLGQPRQRLDPAQRLRHEQQRARRQAGVGAWRRRLPREVERRILAQDRLLELLELLAGLEPELVREYALGLAIRAERFCLTPRAIEREHQLAAQALPERMLGDERAQLADQVRVAAGGEIRVDALFARRPAQLLEPGDLGLRERLVGQVGERGPAPRPAPAGGSRRRGRDRIAAPRRAAARTARDRARTG